MNAGKGKLCGPCSSEVCLICSCAIAGWSRSKCELYDLQAGAISALESWSGQHECWPLAETSAYNVVLCQLSPRLISPRQQVGMPDDRLSPVCRLEGMKPAWPFYSPGWQGRPAAPDRWF